MPNITKYRRLQHRLQLELRLIRHLFFFPKQSLDVPQRSLHVAQPRKEGRKQGVESSGPPLGSLFRPRKVRFFEKTETFFRATRERRWRNLRWKFGCRLARAKANFSTKDCWAEDFKSGKHVVDAGGQHGANLLANQDCKFNVTLVCTYTHLRKLLATTPKWTKKVVFSQLKNQIYKHIFQATYFR